MKPDYKDIRYGECPKCTCASCCNLMHENMCFLIEKPVDLGQTCYFWDQSNAIELLENEGFYQEDN